MHVLRFLGFLALLVVLFSSLFRIEGADLTNNVTAVALMVLLLSVFSDLKEFNFWGLTGKRDLKKELKELKGKQALDQKKLPKVSKNKIQQVRMNTEVVTQEGSPKANFLELFFEIENLLRTLAALKQGKSLPVSMQLKEVIALLSEKGILTLDGIDILKYLQILRDQIVNGDEKVTDDMALTGKTLAEDIYSDLKKWVAGPI